MIEQKIAKDNLILKTVTGSFLYGTETIESDADFQGIFIPPKEYVIGLQKCEQVIIDELDNKGNKIDYTIYTLPKYIHLAIQNNPNIISMLYTPEKHIIEVDKFGQKLLDNKHLFLSKKSYHTFKGYAYAQKRKILTKEPIGKRVELINKFGYDVKFASHLIRLLYEALDILTIGELTYPSPHRRELKAIKLGEWTLDKVLAESERLEKLIDEAYVKSNLQHKANLEKIQELQMILLDTYWSK